MIDILALVIAGLHIYIFFLESVLWMRERTNKLFRLSRDSALANQAFAFNQGFYNLFLAVEIIVGVAGIYLLGQAHGRILVDFAVFSVLGAGLVLFISNRALVRAACIQAIPAALYFALRLFQG